MLCKFQSHSYKLLNTVLPLSILFSFFGSLFFHTLIHCGQRHQPPKAFGEEVGPQGLLLVTRRVSFSVITTRIW